MKSHMDDVEDDLAAEEENKLINEVRRRVIHCTAVLMLVFLTRSIKHGNVLDYVR